MEMEGEVVKAEIPETYKVKSENQNLHFYNVGLGAPCWPSVVLESAWKSSVVWDFYKQKKRGKVEGFALRPKIEQIVLYWSIVLPMNLNITTKGNKK